LDGRRLLIAEASQRETEHCDKSIENANEGASLRIQSKAIFSGTRSPFMRVTCRSEIRVIHHKEETVKGTGACIGTFVAPLFMAAGALVGAGSYPGQTRGTAAAASNSGAEACSVLKKEDVAAALGGTVTGPKAKGPLAAGDGSTVSSCEYSGSGLLTMTLNLTRLPAGQVATYKSFCTDHEGLTGLGDLACWYDKKHEEIHVFKGAAFISIELRGKSNPTDPIKALAKKVIDQVK